MDEAPVKDEPSAYAKEIQMEVTANVNAQVGYKLDDINEREIEQALSLNLTVWPRLNRGGDGIVAVHTRKQLNERERLMAILLAEFWGYTDPTLTWMQRSHIEAVV